MPSAPLLNIKDLSVTMSGERLFEELSLSIEPGELVAVIGGNGCGKTTLLNLIIARATGRPYMVNDTTFAVDGSIMMPPGTIPAYLPQKITGAALSADGARSGSRSVLARLSQDFGITGPDRSLDVLSGGELQKLGLVRVLASAAALYLLDEPTNYLDIGGITALEYHLSRLKESGKGILAVTHDRALANNLADRTILITGRGIYATVGGAEAVKALEAVSVESRRHKAKEISKKIEQLQQDARAKAGWSARSESRKMGGGMSKPYFAKLSKRMAKRAKVVERRIEKKTEELAQSKPFVPKKLDLCFPRYKVRNRNVFRFENVSFGYKGARDAGEMLLNEVVFAATTRDRICLMGDNGSGKTTIIKLIQRMLSPSSGRVHTNDKLKLAYIPQDLDDFFTGDTLLDNFGDCGMPESTVRQHLGSVMIRRDKVYNPVEKFSRGELMRAAVTKCVLLRAEFLLLDEPTSNLDVESIEVLERVLNEFDGGFLVISHDRAFAANVCDRLYVLRGGRLRLV
ncbi:MAG: ABC-F family ATP-binding cassette domain-containing protein [Candidatus Zixiibacteriota bacterium]|nr:MAG: ABC-F family ATP-binding cassette domain-containing protein [candidate division Zixibacteria bacterium]